MSKSSYPRPRFRRQETWRYKRIKPSWRAPRGKSSRMRRSKDGWPLIVKIGYSRAKATRGLHPSGLREVLVWRPKDLQGLDPKSEVARIGHTVGENKRVQIIDEAKKVNIRILNPGVKKTTELEPGLITEPTPETPVEEPKEELTEPSAAEPEREQPSKEKVAEKSKKKTAKKKTTKRKSSK